MESSYKKLLLEYIKNKSLKNLNLDEVIDYLIQNRVIDEETYKYIWSIEKEKAKRTEKLLDYIVLKGEEDLCERFITTLRHLPGSNDGIEHIHSNYFEAVVRGGLPRKPEHNVERTSLAAELKAKLIDLRFKQQLVVHGMIGSGKSCLAAQVLDREVIAHFDNAVYWVNLKEHDAVTIDLLQELWRLYLNIVGNLSKCPDSIEELIEHFKKAFISARLGNTLLVLNDVKSQDVLEIFDFGCKLLITTQHKDIVNSSDATFIELKFGFVEEESLSLLRNCLGDFENTNNKREIIKRAKDIHKLTKGHPMVMALIGCYLKSSKEEALRKVDIWKCIIDILKDGLYSNLNERIMKTVSLAITMCLEKFEEDRLNYYHDLAIFPSNVNIRPEVLGNLWGKNQFEVRQILNDFEKKSLIVSFYHDIYETYIYGIHNLHSIYLKEVTKNQIQELHRKLISCYLNITGNDLTNLSHDMYILAYIGYHLENANLIDEFSIYFNLNFIQNKIRIVGVGDLLGDMEKYQDYITKKDPELEKKLEELKQFVEAYGSDLKIYDKTDIVQYALYEKKTSNIYNNALEIAKENPGILYFKQHISIEKTEYKHLLEISSNITAICSDASPELMLAGTSIGPIVLWLRHRQFKFYGHKDEVLDVQWSPDRTFFLSVSKDGTAKLWKYQKPASARNSKEFSHFSEYSPINKQVNYKDLYTSEESNDESITFIEKDDVIISAAFANDFSNKQYILTGAQNGKITLWDKEGNELGKIAASGSPAKCILFSRNDDCILFTSKHKINIDTIDNIDDNNFQMKYLSMLNNEKEINSLLLVPGSDNLLAVSDHHVILWEIRVSWTNGRKTIEPQKVFPYIEIQDSIISCATITNDGKYFVLGTRDQSICIWDMNLKIFIENWNVDGVPISLDTSYDDNLSLHVLFSGIKKTIYQCHIPSQKPISNNKELSRFDSCCWPRQFPLYTTITNNNTIQIYKSYNLLSEISIENYITCTTFSFCGNNLFFGSNNGIVYSFHYKTKKLEQLMSFSAPVLFLKCLMKTDDRADSEYSFNSSEIDNGVIIGVAANGTVEVILDNEKSIKTRKVFQILPKDLFLFDEIYLIIVHVNCKVTIWNLLDNTIKSFNDNNKTVGATGFCKDKRLLAICYDDIIEIFKLDFNSGRIHSNYSNKLSNKVKSLCFSFDGKLLSVGLIDGKIIVFHVDRNYTTTTLLLHQSPVENLLFSPSLEPVLISLGDQLACWNLKDFQEPVRKKLKELTLNNKQTPSLDLAVWSSKQILQNNVPYLLSCIKLHGHSIKIISASKEFTSFLAVDNDGRIYIMDIV